MRKSYVLAGIAGSLLNKPVVATVHGMHVTAPWIVGKNTHKPFQQFDSIAFYIVAHADDWHLFMHPNVYNDIIAPGCKVIFIVTTAGDSGFGEHFWLAREEGLKSAARFCLAPFNDISESGGQRKIIIIQCITGQQIQPPLTFYDCLMVTWMAMDLKQPAFRVYPNLYPCKQMPLKQLTMPPATKADLHCSTR